MSPEVGMHVIKTHLKPIYDDVATMDIETGLDVLMNMAISLASTAATFMQDADGNEPNLHEMFGIILEFADGARIERFHEEPMPKREGTS